MSPLLKGGGYGHHLRRLGGDTYRICWSYDVKYGRLRYPRGISRITDLKGAKRFARKWKLPEPKE